MSDIVNRKAYVFGLFLACLLLFWLFAGVTAWREREKGFKFSDFSQEELVYVFPVESESETEGQCMGVPILDETAFSVITVNGNGDYSKALRFSDVPVAVDTETNIIYITQPIEEDTVYSQLVGRLSCTLSRCKLYFAPDSAFSNLKKAVSEGHSFMLLIEDRGVYSPYKVVFTTLPVMRLEGGFAGVDEKAHDVKLGSMHFWTFDEENGYTVTSTSGTWNVRGRSSLSRDKKSWKLNLLDEKRENLDVSLAGLGADDDWILNSMSLDDTKLKEKLTMEVWNQWQTEKGSKNYMTTSKYVELVQNGRYCGLYLLQRKIDVKYLALAENEILFKGANKWSAKNAKEAYELEYTAGTAEDAYIWMEEDRIYSIMDMPFFIDTHLFVQWGAMRDNGGYKNMYYILRPCGDEYRLTMVPWDTDFSFGIWIDGAFVYDFKASAESNVFRGEYDDLILIYPDLDQQTAKRWFELRATVFNEDGVYEKLETYKTLLMESGAMQRESARWAPYYGGEDTWDNLSAYIEHRMAFLDTYYGQLLQ